MDASADVRLRLSPEDERTHPVEAARNFNESMYVNVFDHGRRSGGWFRVGNRPNEGHAEMSSCLHFEDGSAGFMFQRPELRSNDRIAAGGLELEVLRPFERVRLAYEGPLCLMKNPQEMADPKRAFASNPILPCRVDLVFEGISPVFGGERVDAHGRPLEEAPEEAFARGHYEQHVRGRGSVSLGGRSWSIDGLGLRDHSWGPRFWQNIHWYRWLPMAFSEDFAMVVSVVALASGEQRRFGMVLRRDANGVKDYVPVEELDIDSVHDEHHQAVAQTLRLRTREREYVVTGRALSLLPLRNRRKTDDGRTLLTRITEAMTEFRCDDHVGYGMSEYLDQIVDGAPAGSGSAPDAAGKSPGS